MMIKRFLLSLSLLFGLVACSEESPREVVYVVVSGEPTTIAQIDTPFAPTLPPTDPVPDSPIPATATSDIPPEITLQIADRFLLDGRYESAVYSYQIIFALGDSAPSDIRAAAAFGMGQASLREGLFDNAVTALTTLIAQFPQDYRAVPAYFMRGEAYSGLGRWQEAIADYQQYLFLRPGVIDSYAHERIADAQLNLNQYDAALQNYALAEQTDRDAASRAALIEKVARLYRLQGNAEQAVAQYDQILSFAQNNAYRASVEYLAAEVLLESGDLSRGLPRMEHVFNTYEGTTAAYDAMQVLLTNNMTIDSYRRGRTYFYAEEYAAAIEAFNQYTTEVSLTEIPPDLYLMLGQAYRAVSNFDAARVSFQTIVEQFPTDALFGEGLLEIGRSYFLEGNIPEAIARYSAIADNYGYLTDSAAEALWRVGYLYGTNGDPTQSRSTFLRLADSYPNTEQAKSGLTIAASAAIEAQDLSGAADLYTRLTTITVGTEQADAYIQLGQIALLQGDSARADQAFSQAIAAAPDSYYSARAADIRASLAPFTPPVMTNWTFDDAVEVAETEQWLRDTFGIVQDAPLWPLSMTLESDPRIMAGRELWAISAIDTINAAQSEFLEVIDDYSDDPLASYQLAIYTRLLGAYYPSIVAAANVVIASGQSTLEVPPYIARLRYPAYFGNEVRQAATTYGIDPLLLFSLIRHESLFNTFATAAAGEKGLTQVIPSTAEYIAGALNWPNYDHADLFRPYAGINFGAFFLAENLNRFDGNVYAGLAGYNAGPGRAIDWMELSGGDPDRFMATITISTTQTYIQRIYSHYNIYRALYGG